jgi:hypothetical protein
MSISLSAQVRFEQGYITSNEGVRTECLVKNRKWVKTPQEVVYKLSENAEIMTATPGQIAGFGVGSVRFVAAEVDFDDSPMDFAKIGYDKHPVWVKRTLFVQVLVHGKASLYLFTEGDGDRFFLSTENDNSIRQLVNKPFYKSSMDVYYNDLFRARLLAEVSCEASKIKSEDVSYTRSSLRNYFRRYNECMGEHVDTIVEKKKKFEFHFSITPGTDFTMFRAESYTVNTDFKNETSWRYGAELEVVFPFNARKWSLFIEPTYQSYQTTDPFPATIKSVEFPIGARHYFYATNTIRAFINCAGVVDYPLETRVKYHELLDPVSAPETIQLCAAFGAGIKVWRFSAEARYYTPRSRFDSKQFRHLEQEKLSLIVGLRIF